MANIRLIVSSFFFVRIKQNPEHYAIPGATTNKPSSEAWEGWIKWYVEVRTIMFTR